MRWLIALTATTLMFMWVDAVAAEGGASTSAPAAYEYPCTAVDPGLIQQVAVSVDTLNRTIAVLENVSGRTLPGAVKVPTAFVPALLKDFDTARSGGHFSPLTSQTLEQVGRFGLQTLPRFVDALKAEGRLPGDFNIPPTTFGVPDLTAGVASHLGTGRLGVGQVTLYLDGISKMTAAVAGMLVGGPSGARIAESTAGLAQVTLRGLTIPLFQEHFSKPVRQAMEDNWRALQESRIARGQPIQRFSEMFGAGLLASVGFDARRIGELDRYADWANTTQGGTRLDARLPAPVVGPRVIVDIPGVNWTGGAREADWGTLLRPDRTTIYVRHQGPGLDRWDKPEPGAVVVLLPPKLGAKAADAQLLPHLRAAFASGRDVHVVVDTNITFARHVLPLPKPEEDRWAADVTRYVGRQIPAAYSADLAEYSRGTATNRYLTPSDFARFQNVYIISPRGDDAISWVARTPNRPNTYIITGLSDAPGWRWNESLSSVRTLPNVLVIERRDIHGPATTHSLLQNLDSAGTWRIGDAESRGSLRQVLAQQGVSVAVAPSEAPGGVLLCGDYTEARDPTGLADRLMKDPAYRVHPVSPE